MREYGHIVVIDDDPILQDLLGDLLRAAGYTVESYQLGMEGLEAVRRRPPDLVFLDIVMPDINGLEVCRALKEDERTRDLPVIFLTARGEEEDLEMGMRLGADDYLVKPFRDDLLLARAASQIRWRRFYAELMRERKDRETLLGLSHTLTSSLRISEILYTVVNRLAEVVEVDRCSVVLDDGRGQYGYVVASSDDPSVKHLRLDLDKYPEIREV